MISENIYEKFSLVCRKFSNNLYNFHEASSLLFLQAARRDHLNPFEIQ
jgi:hypothetical protein